HVPVNSPECTQAQPLAHRPPDGGKQTNPNFLAAKKLAANKLTADYSPSPVESDYSGTHLLDSGECSIEDCAGFAAVHFALTVGGQFAAEVGCSDFICGSNSPILDLG